MLSCVVYKKAETNLIKSHIRFICEKYMHCTSINHIDTH